MANPHHTPRWLGLCLPLLLLFSLGACSQAVRPAGILRAHGLWVCAYTESLALNPQLARQAPADPAARQALAAQMEKNLTIFIDTQRQMAILRFDNSEDPKPYSDISTDTQQIILEVPAADAVLIIEGEQLKLMGESTGTLIFRRP